jgi:hypothetical protein
MTHDAGSVTATEFERLLKAALEPIKESMATKDDLHAFATKDDLKNFATKEDLMSIKNEMATRDDLNRFATKDDLHKFATKEDMQRIEKDLGEMRLEMATKDEMNALQKTLDSDRLLADQRFAWLREGIDQTLIVLGNVEKKLEGKIVGHRGRIKRLEKRADLAQTAA